MSPSHDINPALLFLLFPFYDGVYFLLPPTNGCVAAVVGDIIARSYYLYLGPAYARPPDLVITASNTKAGMWELLVVEM